MASSWTVSVVSHGHGDTVQNILRDLHQQLIGREHQLILTLNIPERLDPSRDLPADLRNHLRIRHNEQAMGFGANHNAALAGAESDFIMIADPDLNIPGPIIKPIEDTLINQGTGIVSPRAYDLLGNKEDNGRMLNSPWSMLKRQLIGQKRDTRKLLKQHNSEVEWIAGLFMAMRNETFTSLSGFDTGYFMYVEDTDLCIRAQITGLSIQIIESLTIIHPARRRTFRSPRHFYWHLRSLIRLWKSPSYRQFRSLASNTQNNACR